MVIERRPAALDRLVQPEISVRVAAVVHSNVLIRLRIAALSERNLEGKLRDNKR
jgi:hypothetical protein